MSIEIRKATAADLDAIDAIYDRIHDEEERGDVTIGWVRGVYPSRATAQEALGRGDLFVELSDGAVVGTAVINGTQVDVYRRAAWQYEVPDSQIMVLHTLVIDPLVKRGGLGRAFVEFYEQYARLHGCTALRLDTNERNSAARGFYKRLGYAEIGVQLCTFNNIPSVNLVLLEKGL